MAKNEVIQLVSGSLKREGEIILEAHSSATLVLCENRRILVDTSTSQKRRELLTGLESRGVAPEDIDTVVLTHLHVDHTENDELFTSATFMAHVDEIPPKGIEPVLDEDEICDGVTLLHTPGHTRGSMSVLVEAERRYVIAGDALPTRDNYIRWVPPRLTYHPELALKSMRRIVDRADVVIPGHDRAFEVDR
jgi:N-acyl homoserine lactone hydrolase